MGEMIQLGDDGITGGEGRFQGSFPAYRCEPEGEARGGLVVIHEIWGLTDHIKDVADRFAAEGYLVVAPDILSNVGVSPEVGQQLQDLVFHADEARRSEAQPMMRERLAPARSPEFAAWGIPALQKVVDYLATQPGVQGRIGVVGYCFGGTYSFALAANDPRVRAAVPYYGHPPEQVASIRCPVLAFYGDQDTGLMQSLPDVQAAMDVAGVDFTAEVYEGAKHAFFNDTNKITYKPDAAADSWRRTLAFFAENLVRPLPEELPEDLPDGVPARVEGSAGEAAPMTASGDRASQPHAATAGPHGEGVQEGEPYTGARQGGDGDRPIG